MSSSTLLGSGLRWTATATVVNFLLSLVQTALLTRLLTKTDFGWVAIAGIFVNIGIQIQNAGINTALIQRPVNTQAQLSALYWLNQCIGVLLLLIGLAIAHLSGIFYQSAVLAKLSTLYSMIFVINALSVQHKAILQKKFCFRELAWIEMIAALFSFATALVSAWYGWGAMSLIMSYLIRYIIETAGVLKIGFQRFVPNLQFRWSDARVYGALSTWLTVERLVTHLVSQLDVILITKWLGTENAGVYDVFKRVLMRPSVLLNVAIEKFSLPLLSNFQQDNVKLAKIYLRLLNISLTFHFFMYVLVILMAPWLVKWYFGASWTPHLPTFQVLCLFVLIYAWLNPIESLLLAKNKIHWQLIIYLIMLPLLIVVIRISSYYGLYLTAISILTIHLLFSILFYSIIIQKLRLFSLAQLGQTIGKSLVIAFISFGISNVVFPFSLHLSGFIFIICYLYLNYLFNPTLFADIRNIEN